MVLLYTLNRLDRYLFIFDNFECVSLTEEIESLLNTTEKDFEKNYPQLYQIYEETKKIGAPWNVY